MKYLVFDTETTGKALFSHPPTDPQQPHIVQLGAVLYDGDTHTILKKLDHIIKPSPDGYTTIDPGAEAKHGISLEKATAEGIDLMHALLDFYSFMIEADIIVAHNLKFDMIMLMASLHRCNFNDIKIPRRVCTMEEMTNICKLRGAFRGKYKWPTLTEAHQHCTGMGFDNAHNAMADVIACAVIFQWLVKEKHVSL